MKKCILLIVLLSATAVLLAQPGWLNLQTRKTEYPNNTFFTGFASDEILPSEKQNDAIARIKKMAQGDLAASVRVAVDVATSHLSTSVKVNDSEQFKSIFEKTVKTAATIELTDAEPDYHVEGRHISAFVYVNKYELKGNYLAVFKMNMQQLESILNTAQQLETIGEKAKARIQYEETVPLLIKIEQAQDVLVTLDKNASLQREKTAAYRSTISLACSKIALAIFEAFAHPSP